MKQPSVYDFFDYRSWLKAVVEVRRQQERGFSLRTFTQQAGIAAPNYLARVLSGSRSLSVAYAGTLADAFRLGAGERAYFLALVEFESSKNPEQREELVRKLLAMRNKKPLRKIENGQLRFFLNGIIR